MSVHTRILTKLDKEFCRNFTGAELPELPGHQKKLDKEVLWHLQNAVN
jgi:hypothetical protein